MGADVHGFVECRATHRVLDPEDAGGWAAAIDLDLLYAGRSYDAFGCLFGVRNHAGFRPLAADRGLPDDVSAEARHAHDAWGRDAHSASWIGWAELSRVDWDEPAERVDERVHEYRRGADGGWILRGKASKRLRDRPAETEWTEGDTLFRVTRTTRRDAVPQDGDWAPVWAVMRTLAAVHGEEHVRLVVWFDN
ncbi:hypothetical protein [Streptomyces aurantiogriseus]|uniref:Uncharacterized protein n=1 Tax=Streptomyces aurantiogriseus TaxID=66870 RepID=A0A918CJB4_9ACTN|nr:hypothetical protein [Streptomyces aurantiogriseus]GGR26001.1 hypothetical protein GCM10010251_47700 [Streptomyces aurantiogriseus]